MRGLLIATLALTLLGCGPSTPRRSPSKPDKRELFGDPGLVPTREGERIRRELALADELERLLARADVPASATVSLIEPASAVVVARNGERPTIEAIASATLPELDAARIHVTIAKPSSSEGEEPGERRPTPGLLVLIGLGVGLGLALGVALERAWQRQR